MKCVLCEEGVEGKVGDEDAVYERDDAWEDEEDEERVEVRGSEGLQGDQVRTGPV